MKNNRNAVVDRLFEWSQIWNGGFECVDAKEVAELFEERLLVGASTLEPGRHVTKQLQVWIVLLLNMSTRGVHVLCAECSPLS